MSSPEKSSPPDSVAHATGDEGARDFGFQVLHGGAVNPIFEAYIRRVVAPGSNARAALVAALAETDGSAVKEVGRELSSYGVTSASRPSFRPREARVPAAPRVQEIPAPAEPQRPTISPPRPGFTAAPLPAVSTAPLPAIQEEHALPAPVRLRVGGRNVAPPSDPTFPAIPGMSLPTVQFSNPPAPASFPPPAPVFMPGVPGTPSVPVGYPAAPLVPLAATSFPFNFPASSQAKTPVPVKKKAPSEFGVWMARLLTLVVVAAMALLAAVVWFDFDYAAYLPAKQVGAQNGITESSSSEDPFGPAPALVSGEGQTNAPLTPPVVVRPDPSPAFVDYVRSLRISGVMQGDPVRAILDGRIVRAGEMADPILQVQLTGSDPEKRLLIFEDATGAQVTTRY